jgi:TolB-like protein
MERFVRAARAVMALAMVAVLPGVVQAQAKPVIAVMYFENNTIGRDRADYDGIGKGIAELIITDMAANSNVRVVERERVQALLVEQNLTKEKHIDPQTAIRIGKIIGAQYMITGGLQSDGRGNFALTSRVINVETSQITNPLRLPSKGEDMLGLIAQLSQKLNTEMKLPALVTGQAGSGPQGTPAVEQASAAPASAPAASAPATKAAPAPTQRVAAKPANNRKMDIKTAMLYSKALEEEDAGNRAKAVELYKQVDVAFPDYAPVTAKLRKLS